MKTSTNIHYRREYRSLLPISVFSRVQMVATAAFEATQRANRCNSRTTTLLGEEVRDKVRRPLACRV